MSAKARCVVASSYTGEYTLITTYSAAITPVNGTMCGLTAIGGRLRIAGDGAAVARHDDGHWTFGVNSTYGGYVMGRARCITRPTGINGPYWWHSPEPGFSFHSNSDLCIPTMITGPFRSASDWAWTFRGGLSWYLIGTPPREAQIQARCINYITQ